MELKELVVHAVKHNTSAPDVWNAILGGINENSSTGLRKWAAKQGRGNDSALLLESILLAKGQRISIEEYMFLKTNRCICPLFPFSKKYTPFTFVKYIFIIYRSRR